MTMPPLLAPPEAQPTAHHNHDNDDRVVPTESLARPFRLGLAGLGAAVGLFARLLAANGFGELNSRPTMLAAAATSALIGIGLLLMAAERDRFGLPLVWLSGITALAWGALSWISPPFATEVTVWSKPDQAVLAVVGVGNGLLLAGIVALAFVRRHPTLSVAATLLAGVFGLASNSIVLRDEWPAIVALGFAFALILLAWDRSPRQELKFAHPQDPPRVSRAALSFISVAFCGTAIQLWLSRTEIPRAIPAVALCAVLLIAAFASLIRVRREIEQRETTLSEWTSWMREIRTNDFRAEMENFESPPVTVSFDSRPPVGDDGQAPRPLSFPNLVDADAVEKPSPVDDQLADAAPAAGSGLVADTAPATTLSSLPGTASSPVPEIVVPTAANILPRIEVEPVETRAAETPGPAQAYPTPDAGSGVFSSLLSAEQPAEVATEPGGVSLADLDAFAAWLNSPAAAARQRPLVVAIEAMSLEEFDSLPADDSSMATGEIGSYLAHVMPSADLVSWIDGPYFIVAHASKSDSELLALNKDVRKALKATNGVAAFLRPGTDPVLDDLVNEAVLALLQARKAEQRAAGI